jgi:hypothetical protein
LRGRPLGAALRGRRDGGVGARFRHLRERVRRRGGLLQEPELGFGSFAFRFRRQVLRRVPLRHHLE